MWSKIKRVINFKGIIALAFLFIGFAFNLIGIVSIYAVSFTHSVCSNGEQLIYDRNQRFKLIPDKSLQLTDICLDSVTQNLEVVLKTSNQTGGTYSRATEYLTHLADWYKLASMDLGDVNITSKESQPAFMKSVFQYSSILAEKIENLEGNFEGEETQPK